MRLRETNGDRHQLEFKVPVSIMRTGFGLVLALFGVLVFVLLVEGVARPGGMDKMLAQPGKTVGIVAFASGFLLMGWFAAFHRNRMVIRPEVGEILDISDWRIFKRVRRYRCDSFDRVVLVSGRTMGSAHSTAHRFNSVYLVKPDRDWVPVLWRWMGDASGLATDFSNSLKLPLKEMQQEQWEKFSTVKRPK